MIRVFSGDDRVKAEREIDKILGLDHETIDAENLSATDLPSIFFGVTFFESARKILIRDFFANSEICSELEKYLDTPHEIILFEQKIDGRSAEIKELKKNKKIVFEEFKIPQQTEKFVSFNIYDQALKDGNLAVKKLQSVKGTEDPYMMLGAWNSAAIKNLSNYESLKNKRIVMELAKIDMLIKSTSFSNNPWVILESFLLRLKNL